MKKVEKKEYIERIVTKYVAEDGTEFDHYDQCKAYEYESNVKKLKQIEHCTAADDYSNVSGDTFFDDNHYYWYRPHTKEEIDLLVSVYGEIDGCLTEDDINKWICVEVSTDSAWFSRLDDGVAYVTELFDKLGYRVNITEKQTFDKNLLCKNIGNHYGRFWKIEGRYYIDNGAHVYCYQSTDALLADWLNTLIEDTDSDWAKEIEFIKNNVEGVSAHE